MLVLLAANSKSWEKGLVFKPQGNQHIPKEVMLLILDHRTSIEFRFFFLPEVAELLSFGTPEA